jgi:hypothetical protein
LPGGERVGVHGRRVCGRRPNVVELVGDGDLALLEVGGLLVEPRDVLPAVSAGAESAERVRLKFG